VSGRQRQQGGGGGVAGNAAAGLCAVPLLWATGWQAYPSVAAWLALTAAAADAPLPLLLTQTPKPRNNYDQIYLENEFVKICKLMIFKLYQNLRKLFASRLHLFSTTIRQYHMTSELLFRTIESSAHIKAQKLLSLASAVCSTFGVCCYCYLQLFMKPTFSFMVVIRDEVSSYLHTLIMKMSKILRMKRWENSNLLESDGDSN